MIKRIALQLVGILITIKRLVVNRIWHIRLGTMGRGTTISNQAIVYQASMLHVGNNVRINDLVHIWAGGGVNIGDDTLVAANVTITSVTHDKDAGRSGKLYRETRIVAPIRIGSNVWIGSGAIIMPGIAIGNNSIVGAGSVVTKDIPPGEIFAGVPAKSIRKTEFNPL